MNADLKRILETKMGCPAGNLRQDESFAESESELQYARKEILSISRGGNDSTVRAC